MEQQNSKFGVNWQKQLTRDPSHKHFLQQLLSNASDEFQIHKNVLRAVRLEAIHFLRLHFCKFQLGSSTGLSECFWMHILQKKNLTCTLFHAHQNWKHLAKKLECINCLQSFFGMHASHVLVKDGCAQHEIKYKLWSTIIKNACSKSLFNPFTPRSD